MILSPILIHLLTTLILISNLSILSASNGQDSGKIKNGRRQNISNMSTKAAFPNKSPAIVAANTQKVALSEFPGVGQPDSARERLRRIMATHHIRAHKLESINPSSGDSLLSGSKRHSTEFNTNGSPEHKWNTDNYDITRELGEGTFGVVYRVIQTTSRQRSALKVINKTKLLDGERMNPITAKKQAENELFLLSATKGNLLFTQLHGWFESVNSLYIVMEIAPHDLFNLSESIYRDEGREKIWVGYMLEEELKYYLAALIAALEQIHELGFCHCDLKEENVLLDSKGGVKLADFGLSWNIKKDGKIKIAVGTEHFLAPEIIRKRRHLSELDFDEKVDMWALGVLAFMLRSTLHPFGEEYTTKREILILHQNILDGGDKYRVNFANDFSPLLEDLIKKLLDNDPDTRVSAKEAKDHGFFKGVDWKAVAANKHSTPPFVPVEKDAKVYYHCNYDGTYRDIAKVIEKK